MSVSPSRLFRTVPQFHLKLSMTEGSGTHVSCEIPLTFKTNLQDTAT